MVMLKAKDTSTFQRHTVMGDHYLYQSKYKNVSKYTLLNECNVMTH